MIAALASGLMGQIEGMNRPSTAMSSISSFLGDPLLEASQPTSKTAQSGSTSGASTMSDQVQSFLLGLQSGTDAQGATQADDVGDTVGNWG